MEYLFELKRNSIDQQEVWTSDKSSLPHTNRRLDFRERFKHEKAKFSHSEKLKDVSSKASGSDQKRRIRRSRKEDELVKYMSKVPNYLERGKDPQEKFLNVGVLDWGRLQRWQNQTPHGSDSSSRDSSTVSLSPSTDASSSQSGRGDGCSAARQIMHRRSLQSHLMSSPLKSQCQAVKSPSGESMRTFHDLKNARSTTLNKPLVQNHQEINLEKCKRKVAESKIDRQSGFLSSGVKYEVASTTKVKMVAQDGQFIKGVDKLEEGKPELVAQGVAPKQKHTPLSNDLGVAIPARSLNQKSAEASQKGFPERSDNADHDSDIQHLQPIPCEVRNIEHVWKEQSCTIDAKIDNFTSQRSQSVPRSAKVGINPSRVRNVEDRQSTATAIKLPANERFTESDSKGVIGAPGKLRSTSPFRRLSISMSKMGKTSSSKEASLPQLRSTNVSGISGAENSNHDKSDFTATSRARSSPLRRLLDPILKSKPANCRSVSEPLLKESVSRNSVSKPSDRPICQEMVPSAKKHGPFAVQALLRVAVKNGQPLFTFAVDKERNILAATMKKLSTSRKEDYSCIYTFFAIQEAKKKNGRWLHHGGKGQNHDYIPNVIAQMKVFGSHFANLTRDNYVNQISMREFVLSSVELTQAEEQTADFQPTDELAAIVIKDSARLSSNAFFNGYPSNMHKDFSEFGLKDYQPEVTVDSSSGKNAQDRLLLGGQGVTASVILPSGVHTIPHKGGPSSLIQRWRSGGSCDCGGWDLGCKLRVFTNRNQLGKEGGPSPASSAANQFELFSQGGAQENQPFFSLSPFKDGIYSVEFNSSLSLLQAFSICIAVLDSKKPCNFSASNDPIEQKLSGETILVQNDVTSATSRGEGEVPAKYVSYPPHSPVGRV